jgi:hypothetical protein
MAFDLSVSRAMTGLIVRPVRLALCAVEDVARLAYDRALISVLAASFCHGDAFFFQPLECFGH